MNLEYLFIVGLYAKGSYALYADNTGVGVFILIITSLYLGVVLVDKDNK